MRKAQYFCDRWNCDDDLSLNFEDLHFSKRQQRLWGPTLTAIQLLSGVLSTAVKRPGREAEH
jgi:hypothetical protein